jgi:hypothetical protein
MITAHPLLLVFHIVPFTPPIHHAATESPVSGVRDAGFPIVRAAAANKRAPQLLAPSRQTGTRQSAAGASDTLHLWAAFGAAAQPGRSGCAGQQQLWRGVEHPTGCVPHCGARLERLPLYRGNSAWLPCWIPRLWDPSSHSRSASLPASTGPGSLLRQGRGRQVGGPVRH